MCERLPWWEGWLGPTLAVLLTGIVVSIAMGSVGRSARTRFRSPDQHWSERARTAFELRFRCAMTASASVVLIVFSTVAWASASGCSNASALAIVSSAGVLIVLASWFRTAGKIHASYSGTASPLRVRVRSVVTHLLVLRPALLVAFAALIAGFWLPKEGWLWLWLPLFAALLYAISTGVTYSPARAFGLVVPARPAVVRAVERARSELPTPVRGVDELTWLMPNALAFPLLGRVAVTQACADVLDEDALSAIALHELAHLSEPKSLRWFRPLLALSLLPVATITLLGSRFELLLALVLFSLLLVAFGLRFTRRMEHHADAHAAEHSLVYASALESLHRAAGIPAVLSKRTSHPSLYDRMLAAGAVPSYPRPKPPRTGLAWLSLVWLPFAMVGLDLLRDPIRDGLAHNAGGQAAMVRAALGGGPTELLEVASAERADPILREMLIEHALTRAPADRQVLHKVARLRNMDCPAIREMLERSRVRSHDGAVPAPSAFWQCRGLSVPETTDPISEYD